MSSHILGNTGASFGSFVRLDLSYKERGLGRATLASDRAQTENKLNLTKTQVNHIYPNLTLSKPYLNPN